MIKIVFEEHGQTKSVYRAENGSQVSSILRPTRNADYYKFLCSNLHAAGESDLLIGSHLSKYMHKKLGLKHVLCRTLSNLNQSLLPEVNKLFDLSKSDKAIKDFINAFFHQYETVFKMRTGIALMVISRFDDCEDLPDTFKTKKMDDGQYCYYDYRISNDDIYKLYSAIVSN